MNISCEFHGTAEELEDHLPDCHYEALKDYLQATEARMSKLQQMVEQKDERLTFLTNVLGKLSTRVEALEKSTEDRLGMTNRFDLLAHLAQSPI